MTGFTQRAGDALAPRFAAVRAALRSDERSQRGAVVVGRIAGLGLFVCFATGMYSHLLQDPLPGMVFPTWPDLYRFSQGLHVTVGTALIPIVLAKLWIVYPRLFAWPPVASAAGLLERAAIAALVSTTLLQLVMGALNTFHWYPWPFSFRATHFALSWVIVGSLLVHIGVKLPLIVRWWRRGGTEEGHDERA